MRNFGEHEGNPCLVLGYRKDQGNVLILHLDDIAEDNETNELISFLQRHRNNLNNIANIVASTPEGFLGYPHLLSYYSSKRASDGNGMALRQIPEFYVKLYDKQQAESWTGSSARYTNVIKAHRFIERFNNASGTPQHNDQLYREPVNAPMQSDTVEESLTDDATLEFLKSNNYPIPAALQTNQTPAPEPVSMASEPAVNTNMDNDVGNKILNVLEHISDQLAEQNGNFKRVFKRFDDVDTSVRSAARNLEKAGFDKPETPPTPAQRKRAKSESIN